MRFQEIWESNIASIFLDIPSVRMIQDFKFLNCKIQFFPLDSVNNLNVFKSSVKNILTKKLKIIEFAVFSSEISFLSLFSSPLNN
jgi:hypothetical protein